MKNKLTLNERVEVACEQGLYRTYEDSYTHKCLDDFKVPRTVKECDKDDLQILKKIRRKHKSS